MTPPLKEIDLSDIVALENWYERFELYCVTNKEITEATKTAHFLTLAGEKAYALLKDLFYPNDIKSETLKDLHERLLNHIRPANIVMIERSKFHKIQRSNNESLKEFLLRVYQQGTRCDFGGQLEEQLRDRMVVGVNDADIERNLLSQPNLTYKRTKEIIAESEKINAAITTTTQVLNINKFQHRGQSSEKQVDSTRSQFNKSTTSSQFKPRYSTSTSLSSQPIGKCY